MGMTEAEFEIPLRRGDCVVSGRATNLVAYEAQEMVVTVGCAAAPRLKLVGTHDPAGLPLEVLFIQCLRDGGLVLCLVLLISLFAFAWRCGSGRLAALSFAVCGGDGLLEGSRLFD